MKNWLRCSILIIILTLCLGSIALADFSDVSEDDWFYDELTVLVEREIVTGYEDGSFLPYDSVKVGEVLKTLCIYWEVDAVYETDGHWAQCYADTAYRYRWIDSANLNLDREASRKWVAEVVLKSIGAIGDDLMDCPFADTDNRYANTLYDMGIVNGSDDGTGLYFYPDTGITRAEYCAMINRTEDYMQQDYGVTDFRYLNERVPEPYEVSVSSEYFDQLFTFMMLNDVTKYTFELPYDSDMANEDYYGYTIAFESFSRMQDQYHEVGAFYERISQGISGDSTVKWTIELSDPVYSSSQIVSFKNGFLLAMNDVVQSIYDKGWVDISDSEYDKAEYFYKWCAVNFAYDTNFNDISYTGYGMLQNNIGVCQGYVSVYNVLCKLSGIDIIGISGIAGGEQHIWCYAELDGKNYYIDPTWGDPVPDVPNNYLLDYFAIDYAKLSETHTIGEIYLEN